MREHVEGIIKEHGIVYRPIKDVRQSRCFPWRAGEKPVVQFPIVRSARVYAIALHELGHALGRQVDHPDDIGREQDAWEWARDNAIVWTPEMERLEAACMRRATMRWEAGTRVLNALHERAQKRDTLVIGMDD
jgi:hypothetical protein